MANDPLVFNTAGMRSIANQIRSQATQAQNDHENAWGRMQQHIASYPGSLQTLLFSVVDDHQKRMGKSYHWQIAFADALSSSADLVDQTEAEINQMFE